MKRLVVVWICLILAGCGDKVHTVEYYQKHTDEANALMSKCMTPEFQQQAGDNPDKKLNCQHAAQAQFMNAAEKMKESGKPLIPKPNL